MNYIHTYIRSPDGRYRLNSEFHNAIAGIFKRIRQYRKLKFCPVGSRPLSEGINSICLGNNTRRSGKLMVFGQFEGRDQPDHSRRQLWLSNEAAISSAICWMPDDLSIHPKPTFIDKSRYYYCVFLPFFLNRS